MAESRDVVFGRKPLDNQMGFLRLAEHWAVKVGSTWYEVSGPDSDHGHVNKTNKERYVIADSDGPTSVSGAAPWNCGLTPTSLFWPVVLSAVGIGIMTQVLGGSPWEGLGLFVKIVPGAFVADRMTFNILMPTIARCLGYEEQEKGRWIHSRGSMCCTVLLLCEAAMFAGKVTMWGGSTAERVVAVFGMPWIIWLLRREGSTIVAIWRGEFRDTSIIGTTKRTHEEIKDFNDNFKADNPEYQVLSVNCQGYVRSLVAFLMEGGEQMRHLPSPESPGSLLTRLASGGRNLKTK